VFRQISLYLNFVQALAMAARLGQEAVQQAHGSDRWTTQVKQERVEQGEDGDEEQHDDSDDLPVFWGE
jgi:hypothetical protein